MSCGPVVVVFISDVDSTYRGVFVAALIAVCEGKKKKKRMEIALRSKSTIMFKAAQVW